MKKLLIIILTLSLYSLSYGAIPYTFGPMTGPVPLSNLDDNFTYIMSGMPNIFLGTIGAQSSWVGSTIQVGPSASTTLPPLNLSVPNTAMANLSLLRTVTASNVNSHGLQSIVITPVAGTPQSAVAGYFGVLNNINTSGGTIPYIAGVGVWANIIAQGTAPTYGVAVDINDMTGNSPLTGFHTAISRKAQGSIQGVTGVEILANESTPGITDFTQAIMMGKVGGTTVKWGTGIWGGNGDFSQYFIALATDMGAGGIPVTVAWGVNKDGVMYANAGMAVCSTCTATTWTTPSLTACQTLNAYMGVTNFSNPGYFKDSMGVVHFRGTLFCSSLPSYVFTLPSGYYPSKDTQLAVACTAGDTINGSLTVYGVGANAGKRSQHGADSVAEMEDSLYALREVWFRITLSTRVY